VSMMCYRRSTGPGGSLISFYQGSIEGGVLPDYESYPDTITVHRYPNFS
jgi:hypothetical protein